MKQRYSSLDVRVIAHELSAALVSLRLANVYDLSSKIFLLKFAKPENKKQLIVDSGFRCHLTSFSRATAAAPSDFVTKLRRHLKTRRVTSVSQVGTDRIIEFQFSDGRYRLYLEFYAGGNILLTDDTLKILAILRTVTEGEGQEELRGGLQYSLADRQNYNGTPALTKERLEEALQKAVSRGEIDLVAGKKQKKKGADALRKALAVSITEFPPILVDHAMRITNFDYTLKPADVLETPKLLDDLLQSLEEAQRVVKAITSSEVTKGYIISKRAVELDGPNNDDISKDSRKGLIYDDFHPFRPKQFEDDPTCIFSEYEGFNVTVDEFFSSIEGQKLESRLQEREATAKRKLEAARQDQAKRLGGLQEIQQLNIRKAGAIEANVERVQEAMDAVNGLISKGMDWVEIGKLVELEQKRGNPVAKTIKLPLRLEENTVSLLLGEEQFEDDADSAYETDSESEESDDDERQKETRIASQSDYLLIDINLGQTPWANARQYYDERRSAVVKEEKTLQSSTQALKSTEQKIAHDLKKGLKQEKAILRPVRNPLWFEKFSYFISSDGYLVLGGRDAQQNETLYKKYLRKGDIYVHADLQGAGTVVIRNSHPDSPIPPSTLSQAGTLAVASSSAWDSKAGMSAWWVNADQVSKSAPTGEFLPVGSFMVRGKKNFLPPAVLLLGFAVMFRVSEQSKASHLKHRIHDEVSPVKDVTGSQSPDEEGSEDEDISDADDSRSNPLQSTGAENTSASPSVDGAANDVPTHAVQQLQVEDNDDEDNSESEDDDAHSAVLDKGVDQTSTSEVVKTKKINTPMPRGKRGKAKKIAAKYADQDEEDRAAAAALIGSTAGQQKAKAEAEAKAAKEAEVAFQKERRRAQHLKTQAETAKHEEIRKAMLEAGEDVALDDDEAQKLTVLDEFVGTPLPGDDILEAIPVCAPWSALGKYKYKAKLQPGTQKKGKAVKEIVDRWSKSETIKGALDLTSTDRERVWPREMDLIKGWKPEECINCVPVSKVRVVMAGGSASGGGKDSKGNPKKGGQRGKKK